jgi:cob(I)alamin adenosyltransferase
VVSGRSAIDSSVATTRGDDGTTGLLFGGDRIAKDDPRAEAYGTIDEAVAALGLARAQIGAGRRVATRRAGTPPVGLDELGDLILHLQRQLFVVGAELAANPDARDRLEDGRTRVSGAMLDDVERTLVRVEHSITMPAEFVVPGETPTSAALELARTIVRRAERRAVGLRRDGLVPGDYLVPYLNRLADLVWVLARAAEGAESHTATPARREPRPAAGSRAAGSRAAGSSGTTGEDR